MNRIRTAVTQVTALMALSLVCCIAGVSAAPGSADDYDDLDTILASRYPTVSWIAPAGGSIYVAPINATNAITLQATAGSRKSTVTKVEFVYRKDCTACTEIALPAATLTTGTNKSGSYQYVWNNATAGVYLIRAKATDAAGGVNFAGPVNIIVNTAPTVSITSPPNPTTLTAPATFALSATASDSDIGDNIAQVEFYKSTTVFDATTRIATLSVAPWNWSWANVPAGVYSVVARATDTRGTTTSSTPVTLKSNSPPTITLNAPINSATFSAPASIALNANATDADGTISNVTFYKSATVFDATTTIATVTSPVKAGDTKYAATWSAVPVGSYAVTARATDNDGGIATSATANITVCGAPAVAVVSPTANQRFDVVSGGTTTVPLAVSITLPAACGTISKVEYYSSTNATTPIATSTAAPFNASWAGVAAGSYGVTARVYVGTATTGTDSASVSFAVNNLPTVTLTAPNTAQFIAAGSSLTLSATASDAGGAVSKVEFVNGAALLGTSTSTASPYSWTWAGIAAGTYSIAARATDNSLATTTSSPAVSVTSCATPTIALTAPTGQQVVQLTSQTATGTFNLTSTPIASDNSCIRKVEYYFVSGTNSTFIGASTSAPWSFNWTSIPAGSYSVKARVYAGDSTTVYSETSAPYPTLHVNKPPVVILTVPSATQATIPNPTPITLTATATDTDPNVASVSFYRHATQFDASTLIGTVITAQAAGNGQPAQSGSTYQYVWTPTPGTYPVTAVALDGRNAATQSATYSLVVCGAPTVVLTTDAANPLVLPANSANLNAAVSMPNADARCGTISKVDFARTLPTPQTLLFSDTTVPYGYPVSGLALGTTTYTAQATSTLSGAGAVSNTVSITVTANPPSGCSIAGPTSLAANIPGTWSVSCSGGSPITSYSWTRSPAGFSATAASASDTPFTGNTPVSATYTVTVSNSAGSDTKSITVNNASANLAPQIGALQNITTGNGGRAVVGAAYTLRLPVTDSGNPTVSVSGVSGASGSCVVVSGTVQNCDITWTPTAAGMQSVAITVTDSAGSSTTLRTTIAVQTDPSADDVSAAATTSLVGKLAGSFSVSEGGSAGYTVPIHTPPGVNNLVPKVAFTYGSSGSYGMMGIGWSVSGLGAITRCPNTQAQDGFRAGINYDSQEQNDAYCLGGQRLVPTSAISSPGFSVSCSGPGCPAGTITAYKQEFRTEVEGYSRIIGYKDWPQITAGFSRFTVETKDGRVMHYASRFKAFSNGYDTCRDTSQTATCTNGVAATRVKVFLLDRIDDAAGNRLDVEYHTTRPSNVAEPTYVVDWTVVGTTSAGRPDIGGNGSYPPTEILPKTIKYGNGQEIRFYYDAHPESAQLRTFDSGAGESVITQVLSRVEVWSDNSLVKRYALRYDTNNQTPPSTLSPTGRTRLTSMRECSGATDNTCLPATTFQWQGASISSFDVLSSGVGEGSFTFGGDRQLVGDIRGTGRSSLILTDFSGSGVLDQHLRVCDMSGATSTVAGAFACADQYVRNNALTNVEHNIYLADVNGDGKADLVYGQPDTGIHYVCLANADGSGFSSNISAPTTCNQTNVGQVVTNGLLQGDFDGDGRIDILAYRPANTYPMAGAEGAMRHKFDLFRGQSNGTFAFSNTLYFPANPSELGQQLLDQGNLRKNFYVADFNGDGAADLIQRMPGPANTALDQWRVCYASTPSAGMPPEFVCPRDNSITIAGGGVANPAPAIQANNQINCSIPETLLPATGGSVSWQLVYPEQPLGAASAVSTATLLNNGSCTAQNGVTFGFEGINNTIPPDTSSVPAACANGYGVNLSANHSIIVNGASSVVQTVTLTRAAGSPSLPVGLATTQFPLNGLPVTSMAVPAGMKCDQLSPRSVTGLTPAKPEEVIIADFNGDGLADMAAPVDANVKTNGNWQVCLSTGDGGFERWTSVGNRTSTCKTFTGILYAKGTAVVTGDFDGDGRSDLVGWQEPANGTRGWQIAYARGSSSAASAVADSLSFASVTNISAAAPGDAEISINSRVADFNGDGISDISQRANLGGPVRVYSPGSLSGTGGGARQELLTRVIDGLGAVTEIDYAPITDSSVYSSTPTMSGVLTTLAANEIDIRSPMQVVKSVRADNGLDCVQGNTTCPWHTSTFKYYGLRGTTNGRGLLGFVQRDVTESFGAAIGATSSTAYNNEASKWYLAGSPKRAIKTIPQVDANNTPFTRTLSDASFSYHAPRITDGLNGSSALKIIEVFSASSVHDAWDLNGARLPSSVTVTPSWDSNVSGSNNQGYDQDGNVLRNSSSTYTVDAFGAETSNFTKSTVNTYGFRATTGSGNSLAIGDWVLGRLTRSEVTHSKTGATNIVRVSAFNYFGQAGLETSCTAGTGNSLSDPAQMSRAPKGFVCEDISEPDYELAGDRTLWSKTRHGYDGFGNRVASTVSYKNPQFDETLGSVTGYTAANPRYLGSTTYATNGRYPAQISNALGDTETHIYHAGFGMRTDLVGPNGMLTSSVLDNFGRKIRERSFAGGTTSTATISDASTVTEWCFDPPGAINGTAATNDALYGTASVCNAGESHRKRTRVSGGASTITFYDKLQREVRVKAQAFLSSNAGISATANEWTETKITYDVRGRKYQVAKPTGDGTATTTFEYDDLDRVKRETLTGNHGASLTPAVAGITAITDTGYNGLTTTVTRRKAGTDPAERSDQATTRLVDAIGKPVTITDANAGTTTFSHDATGNLLTVIPPGSSAATETMTYDRRGRKTGLDSKQAGTYSYFFNGLGEQVRQADGRAWHTVNTYDSLGRLTQRDERQGVGSTAATFRTNWTYDSGSQCGQKTTGKLCVVSTTRLNHTNTSPQSTNGLNTEVKYTYDQAARLERTESGVNLSGGIVQGDPSSGPKRFVNTTYYDQNSRAQQIGTPGGVVFVNAFASWDGSLYKVSNSSATATHWQVGSRFADGQVKSKSLMGALTTTQSLDGLGRISGIKTGTSGNATLVQNATYIIDSFGSLVERTDTPNGLSILPNEKFQYDSLNRLTGRNSPGQATSGTAASYDAIGNLLTKAGAATYAYTDSSTRRLTAYAGTTIAYDGNGNITADNSRSLIYTPWNVPWSVSRGGNALTWDYDHAHQRSVERSNVHGTTFFSPGGGFELVVPTESTSANPKTIERTYIPSPEGTIGTITNTFTDSINAPETAGLTKYEYWHKDHLGSLVATSSETGVLTQRFSFDAWGKRTCLNPSTGAVTTCSSNGSAGNEERGFTGHEMLDEVGLVHMNGRLYDPDTGRFLQADPVIQDPLNGQNYNRYAYVQNNPLSYTDPTGFSWWTKWRKPILGLVAAIAAPWAVGELFLANVGVGEIGTFAYGSIGSEAAGLTGAGQAAAAMAGGAAAGGVQGGNVQSAVIGAFTAAAQFGVGQVLGHATPSITTNASLALQKAVAHAAIGCASAAASGGSCKAGAASAGFSSLGGGMLPSNADGSFHAGNFLGRMVIGGIASKLAGGKAEQGVLLAAMESLYNQYAGCLGSSSVMCPGSGYQSPAEQWTKSASGAVEPVTVFEDAILVGAGVKLGLAAGRAVVGAIAPESSIAIPLTTDSANILSVSAGHTFKYARSIETKAALDAGHRVPMQLEAPLLRSGPAELYVDKFGRPSISYHLPGITNGAAGRFELGLNPITNTIVHLSFRKVGSF